MDSTALKSELLRSGWGSAIDLLTALERKEPEQLAAWMHSPSTIQLKAMCERFRGTNLYSHRTDPMPFDNDVLALDAVSLRI